jgi:hypothetical protein
MQRTRVLVGIAAVVAAMLTAAPASAGVSPTTTYSCTAPAVLDASTATCVTTTPSATSATPNTYYTVAPIYGPATSYVYVCTVSMIMDGNTACGTTVYVPAPVIGWVQTSSYVLYSCPGGGTLSGSSCLTTTSTSVQATPSAPTCPTGYVLGLNSSGQATCAPDAVTTVASGTTVTVTLPFYCTTGPHAGDPSYSATYSNVQSLVNPVQTQAQATTAATNHVNTEGASWQALYCGSFRSIPETATATNPTTGAVCTATATEASTVSQTAANAAATAAAQAMANAECGVVVFGAFTGTETRSFTGTIAGVNYYGCVNGALTAETGPSFTGTSPSFTAISGGTTQAQANANAAAAAVAMGMANVTATVNAEAAALGAAAATTCAGATTTTTTPGTTTTPTTTTTTPTATSTVTAVTSIWLPIVAIVNSAHTVLTNTNQTIRALLIPLTQVATTTPTLETIDPTTGATTTGCTPTENVAPFTSTNPAGSFTMPNCSIVGGVGDSVMFNFESDTGLAVNSASFTIPNVPSTSTTGYTCPSGGQLDATGTSCVATSSTAASYVQTGSTPIYANGYTCPSGGQLNSTSCVTTTTTAASYAQTGSTPIYTYEQTGSTPVYGNVQTGSYPIYTYEQTGSTPVYGIVGGGGWYAIRGCVGYTNAGGCIWGTVGYGQNPYVYGVTGYSPTYGNVQTGTGYTYTYEQTGSTSVYGNVQTGSTPVYGDTCPSGGSLDASGTSCVATSSTPAAHVQTGSTPIYANGYTCPNGGQLDASGVTCVTGSSYSATYSTVSDITRWRYGVGPDFHPGG